MSNTTTSALQISEVTIGTDKNGDTFKKVTFQSIKFIGNVQIVGTTAKRNFYPTRTVNGVEIKGSPMYNSLAVGNFVEGSIERVETTPYTIPNEGRDNYTATHATVVVLSGENVQNVANAFLKPKGASMLDAFGNPTAKSTSYNSAKAASQAALSEIEEDEDETF